MSMFFSSFPSSGGSSGVSSLNGQTGALTLVAGSNITLTPGSGTITIASTGGGGANTALSNLASTAINADLVWATNTLAHINTLDEDGSRGITVRSGNADTGDSGFAILTSGNSNTGATGPTTVSTGSAGGALDTGGLSVVTGENTGTGASGALVLLSGNTVSTASGAVILSSGNSTGTAAGQVTIRTGTSSSGNLSGTLNLFTGGGTGPTGQSGPINLVTGLGTASGASGDVTIASGADAAQTGNVSVRSGDNSIGPTGSLTLVSGDSSVNGSGTVVLGSGGGSGANSGNMLIFSGAAGANSGNITLVVGTAGGTQGNIKFRKSGNTVTVGDIWTATATDGAGYWAAPSGTMQQTTITLSSSDIINSPTTPIVVVPAVGGKIISLQSVAFQLNYGTTPYVLTPGANSFVSYSDDPTQQANYVSVSDTGFLDASSNQETIRGYVAGNTNNQMERGQGLSFFSGETSITTGDSTLTLVINYFVLD